MAILLRCPAPGCGAPLELSEKDVGGTVCCPRCARPVEVPDEKTARLVPPESSPGVTPELLDWAQRTFSEEEFRAGLADLKATGGRELGDFIREIEREVAPHE